MSPMVRSVSIFTRARNGPAWARITNGAAAMDPAKVRLVMFMRFEGKIAYAARRVKTNSMADVISDYQKWKEQGAMLKTQARQAMESRFRELLTEAVSIAEEYRSDFGAALKPPAGITAFRYKASAKAKSKKTAKAATPK